MPKKFTGENSKAAVARARKDAVRKEQVERKKQAEEDAYWQDDDKRALRKQQRKEEAERKRSEALQRKQENRIAHDEEMKNLAGTTSVPTKVTQATIEANRRAAEEQRRREEEQARLLKEMRLETEKIALEENINRLEMEGESARTITEAIHILSNEKPTIDRHPEKRLRAAYQEFEEKMLPQLKEEYPTYRLSQLRQLLKKQWQKSPENPLNQKIMNIVR